MNRDHSANISYPVKFIYNDSSLVLVSPLPKKISMHVSGYGWNLLRKTFWFDIEPVTIRIEKPLKTKVITSRNLLPLVVDQLNGIKVNYLLKDTIWVNFERRIIKEQTVYVDGSKVSLNQDLSIISPISIEPSKVLVEGPESLLSELGDTLFLTIPQNNIDENFDEEVKIFEVSNLINYDRKNVRVSFKVAPTPKPPVINLDSARRVNDSIKNNIDSILNKKPKKIRKEQENPSSMR